MIKKHIAAPPRPIASGEPRVLEELDVYAIPMTGCHSRAHFSATYNLN
jgi:hypothetical protein